MNRVWQRWSVMAGGVALGWGMVAQAAIAAETVVLSYGALAMEIPIEDLQTLADTGESSEDLSDLLTIANQDPAALRTTLNEPVELNHSVLQIALNTPAGDWMLNQLGTMIQPKSGEAGGRIALRAALLGATANDNQVTLMELMRVYPSSQIVVKGDRILENYSQLYAALEPLLDLAEILQTAQESVEGGSAE